MEYAYFEEKQLALFARGRMAHLLGEADQTSPSPSQFVLQFEVEDVDEVFNRLQEKGIHFITHPTDMTEWGSRVVHFRDPDGNVIELYRPIRR
jgi:predicted enzyme related to lactoylglutathione lyase